MKAVFDNLYWIHPTVPLIYVGLFAAGVLLPAIYCAVRGCPYSLGVIYSNAKKNDFFAKFTIAVYAMFGALSVVVVLLVLAPIFI